MITEPKRSAKGELVFTSFLFVAGVIVLWDAAQLPESQMADFVGSRTFPSIIGWLLVVLSIIQLISVFRGNLGQPEEIEGGKVASKLNLKPFLMMFAGLIFFAFGVPIFGFIFSATVLFTLVVFSLNPKKTRWFIAVPIALAVATAIYFGFTLGLQIDLPWGFDFDFGSSGPVVEEEW